MEVIDYTSILSILILWEVNWSFLIVITSKLFSIDALIVSKSRFSGKIIFLLNFPQKHSEFLITISSWNISGFSLLQEIVNTALLKDISISSNDIPAMGAKMVISESVSKISTAICPVLSSFSSSKLS